LNFLLLKNTEKANQFTASHISLATSNPIPYEVYVKDLYNFKQDTILNNWYWNKAPNYPQFLGHTMRAAISNSAGDCIVDFYLPELPVFSFSNIISFTGIKPDPDVTKYNPDGSTSNFLIKALVTNGTSRTYVPMSGKAYCIKIGTCSFPVRPITKQ